MPPREKRSAPVAVVQQDETGRRGTKRGEPSHASPLSRPIRSQKQNASATASARANTRSTSSNSRCKKRIRVATDEKQQLSEVQDENNQGDDENYDYGSSDDDENDNDNDDDEDHPQKVPDVEKYELTNEEIKKHQTVFADRAASGSGVGKLHDSGRDTLNSMRIMAPTSSAVSTSYDIGSSFYADTTATRHSPAENHSDEGALRQVPRNFENGPAVCSSPPALSPPITTILKPTPLERANPISMSKNANSPSAGFVSESATDSDDRINSSVSSLVSTPILSQTKRFIVSHSPKPLIPESAMSASACAMTPAVFPKGDCMIDELREMERVHARRRMFLLEQLLLKESSSRLLIPTLTPRLRAHWDIVAEEAVWMATDFVEERRWKAASTRVAAWSIRDRFTRRRCELIAHHQVVRASELRVVQLSASLDSWWKAGHADGPVHEFPGLDNGYPHLELPPEMFSTKKEYSLPAVAPLADASATSKAVEAIIFRARGLGSPGLLQNVGFELWPHQAAACRWLHSMTTACTCAALAASPGDGATVSIVAFISSHHRQSTQPCLLAADNLLGPEASRNGNAKVESAASLILCPGTSMARWHAEIAHFSPNLRVAVVPLSADGEFSGRTLDGAASWEMVLQADVILASSSTDLPEHARMMLEKGRKYQCVVWDTRFGAERTTLESAEESTPSIDGCGWWQLTACASAFMQCPRRILLSNTLLKYSKSVMAWRAAWLLPSIFRSPTHTLRWVASERCVTSGDNGTNHGDDERRSELMQGLQGITEPFYYDLKGQGCAGPKTNFQTIVHSVSCALTAGQNDAFRLLSSRPFISEALRGLNTKAAATALVMLQHACLHMVTSESTTHAPDELPLHAKRRKSTKGEQRSPALLQAAAVQTVGATAVQTIGSVAMTDESCTTVEDHLSCADELEAGSGKLLRLVSLLSELPENSKILVLASIPAALRMTTALLAAKGIIHECAVFFCGGTFEGGSDHQTKKTQSPTLLLWEAAQRGVARFNRSTKCKVLVATSAAVCGVGSVTPLADVVIQLDCDWSEYSQPNRFCGLKDGVLIRRLEQRRKSLTLIELVASGTIENAFATNHSIGEVLGCSVSRLLRGEVVVGDIGDRFLGLPFVSSTPLASPSPGKAKSSKASQEAARMAADVSMRTLLVGELAQAIRHAEYFLWVTPTPLQVDETDMSTSKNDIGTAYGTSLTDAVAHILETFGAASIELSPLLGGVDFLVYSGEYGAEISQEPTSETDSAMITLPSSTSSESTISLIPVESVDLMFRGAVQALVDSGLRCDSALEATLAQQPFGDRSFGEDSGNGVVLQPSWFKSGGSDHAGWLHYSDKQKSRRAKKKDNKRADAASEAVPIVLKGTRKATADEQARLSGETASCVGSGRTRTGLVGPTRIRPSQIDPRVRQRQKEELPMEKWTPIEDESLTKISEQYFPNFLLIALVLNTKPAVVGRRRSPRQCQDRCTELNRSKQASATAAAPNAPSPRTVAAPARTLLPPLGYLRPAREGLLHAPWPSHRSEEGTTPSVLPVVQVSERDYQDLRRAFADLARINERNNRTIPILPGTESNVVASTVHVSHESTLDRCTVSKSTLALPCNVVATGLWGSSY